MSRERAEACLRLLAEEEVRRPAGPGPRRIRWAAQLLTAIGALDDEVADRIVADFDLALVARQAFPTPAGRAARLQRRSGGVRFRPAVPVSSRPPGAGLVACRLVRLGQVIPLHAEPGGGEAYLLSYAQTEPGPTGTNPALASTLWDAAFSRDVAARSVRSPCRGAASRHVVGADPGLLLGQQLAVPVGELVEELVAAVWDRGSEVGAVRQLEGQDRRGMASAQLLQLVFHMDADGPPLGKLADAW
jgi:hypothetical protein